MILFRSAEADDAGLIAELGRSGRVATVVQAGLVGVEEEAGLEQLPALAWQGMPRVERCSAPSINAWARLLLERLLPLAGGPWRLHLRPHYGVRATERMGARAWHTARHEVGRPRPEVEVSTGAGEHRCTFIEKALRELLKQKGRQLLKSWVHSDQPFAPDEVLVQLWLCSPEQGWLSVAPAPMPHKLGLSAFVGGEFPVAVDKQAPSRAFAKLVEALARLGKTPAPGESCVDLGASPGGWTYVALQHGARVTAVDRSPLREDLMRHPRLTFVKGDAFQYHPPATVDWLICDVIAAPSRSAALLEDWLRRGETRYFVVTLKLRGEDDPGLLEELRRALSVLAVDWKMTHLCANKGEVCVYGRAKTSQDGRG
jgi:23S rRNA (cytidine2498-2'-O)-methyltransferase